MGVVYEAEQLSLGRRVALKVLPFAATMDPRQLQRFHNEARAAAGLHHTNIVPVFGVGSERGINYYAMQFIDGRTLTEVIAGLRDDPPSAGSNEPTTAYATAAGTARAADTAPVAAQATRPGPRDAAFFRRVAEWGAQAAEALEHAHSLGVVHRDVKPANLMIDSQGKLWVTDFGLARFGADSGLTMTGDLLGTLRYMSPEQALARHGLVDHRTDVYALGATLYELLTLRTVVDGKDRQEVLRRIAFEEPVPPRAVNRSLPADLETVVLKALAKEPSERYATAKELADDLRRFLADQPIRARRPTLAKRAGKWARRHQAAVLATGIALFAITAVLAVSSVKLMAAYQEEHDLKGKAEEAQREEARQRGTAERERDNAEDRLYLADLRQAWRAWQSADLDRLEDLLEAHRPADGERDRRGWEWFYLRGQCEPGGVVIKAGEPGVSALAWSPDGKSLATAAGEGGSIKVWDAATGQRLATLTPADRGTQVTDPLTGQVVSVRSSTFAEAQGLTWRWTPDGSRLLAAEPLPSLVDRDLGRLVVEIQPASLALSPDGKRLALGGQTRRPENEWYCHIAVCDLSGAQKPLVFRGHRDATQHVAWHPDGKRLASASGDEVKVWDAASGKELLRLPGHGRAAWSPDGKLLAAPSAEEKRAVKVWDAANGREVRTLRGHRDRAFQVAWAPDSHRLASSDFSSEVRVWDLAVPREYTPVTANEGRAPLVDWNEKGGLALATAEGDVRVWDPGKRQEVCRLPPRPDQTDPLRWVSALAWSRDGRSLAVATTHNPMERSEITVWDVPARQVLSVLRPGTLKNREIRFAIASVAWAPDGRHLASVHPDMDIKVWDVVTGREVHAFPTFGTVPPSFAWSPDGGRLAVDGGHGTIRLLATATWQELTPWPGHAAGVNALSWSLDGRWLASAGGDRTIRLWDGSGDLPPRVLRGHAEAVSAVAWNSDGSRLASAGADGTLRVWDPAAGQELLALPESASAVVWGPGDRSLVSAGREGVKVWDATSGHQAARPAPKGASPAQRLEDARVGVNLAQTFLETGRADEAEPGLRRAITALRQLADEEPDAPSHRRRLADGLASLGDVLGASGRTAEAARVMAEAFAIQPDLVTDPRVPHRYNAACCAARAGCRQGTDSNDLGDDECARLRGQALDWLRADLTAWNKNLKDNAGWAPVVMETMRHWLADADLSGVRGAALANLPEPERPAWQRLWADVADALANAQKQPDPQTKSNTK
jgi:WD40 repeat protein